MNQRSLERGSIALMILGIICLCQPWVEFLHLWSVLVMLAGLIGFNVAAHLPAPPPPIDIDDTGPVSVRETVGEGHGHG